MPFLQHLRPRLILFSRVILWAAVGLLVMVGLFFQNAPAWGATADCPANPTTGNSTIPIAPEELYLKFGGPPSTYYVSLCKEPSEPVNITTTDVPAGNIEIDPASFSLSSTISKTISVTVATGHPADQPFTVTITHTATSDDPDFDYGSLYVPTVTAYYSPPVAVDDFAAPLFGQSLAINVLANDTDRRGEGLTLPVDTIVTGPAHGTATLNVTQTIQYTPTAGYSGPDSFTYRVEGADGNSDIGTVTISVAEENVNNPQIEEVDPEEGDEVEFESSLGNVDVIIPPLVGVPATSTVAIVFGEVEAPSGDVDDAPISGGVFSGIVLKLQVLVNGVPITPGQLSEPLKLSFVLPEQFVEGLDGASIVIAVWNGTEWVVEGISVILTETSASAAALPDALDVTTITITTTVFGEFAVFSQPPPPPPPAESFVRFPFLSVSE